MKTLFFIFTHPRSEFGAMVYEALERPLEPVPISVRRQAKAGELGDTPYRGDPEQFSSFDEAEGVLRRRHPDFIFLARSLA